MSAHAHQAAIEPKPLEEYQYVFLGFREKKGSHWVKNPQTPAEHACNKYWDNVIIDALSPFPLPNG